MTSPISFSKTISAQVQIETNMFSTFSSPVDSVKTACSPFLSRFSLEITLWLDTDAGGGMLIDVLHNLLNRIRRKKEITGEWKNGLLVKLPKTKLRPLHERVRGDHIAGYFKRTVSLPSV